MNDFPLGFHSSSFRFYKYIEGLSMSPVSTSFLHKVICIDPISSHCNVIAVHTEITIVLVQGLQGRYVGRTFYYFVHPLDSSNHFVSVWTNTEITEGLYELLRIFNWHNLCTELIFKSLHQTWRTSLRIFKYFDNVFYRQDPVLLIPNKV